MSLMIGWTTVKGREVAEMLARGAVEAGLAVCVQVEAPVVSVYRWEGKVEREEEVRLMFKFLEERSGGLEKWVAEQHPYEVPEWVAVRVEIVGEKYLSWAGGSVQPPRP